MAKPILYLENDNNFIVRNLRVESSQAFVSDALFTAAVRTQDGVLISGATAISLGYTADSNGEYRGLVPYSVQLTDGQIVLVTITSSNYPGAKIEGECEVRKRKFG